MRILIPLVLGILAQYYATISTTMSITATFIGLFAILISFLLPEKMAYSYRWVFGIGLYVLLFSMGTSITRIRQWQTLFPFSEAHYVYNAAVSKIPVEKPNTIQLQLLLDDYNRQILGYVEKDSFSTNIEVGQHITFFSKIAPFPPVGDVYNFNYNRYMYHQGYSGITFIAGDMWETSNKNSFSPFVLAERCRKKILNFYQSFPLNNDEQNLLAGLTLGYTADMSDSFLQSFRTTGTAHILAVSGLHVGILYFILVLLFSFVRSERLKQPLVLVLLWIYIFIVGLPPSAVRAGIMLSFISFGYIISARYYTFNSIFGAAFFILLVNPFSLFDLGFQLSFVAVLSICLLLPTFQACWQPSNKALRFIYNTLAVSLSAQIGILPLCLYYFGSIPTYFLFANLLIVQLLSIACYDIILLILSSLLFSSSSYLSIVPFYLFRLFTKWVLIVVQFFEKLPYSSINNFHISMLSVFILLALFLFIRFYFVQPNSKTLICILACCLAFILQLMYEKIENRNTLMVINNMGATEIKIQREYSINRLDTIKENKILCLGNKNFYILCNNLWHHKKATNERLKIDYLLLETKDVVSIPALADVLAFEKIIFGNTISRKAVTRLMQECEKLRIPYYDLYTNGNLTINF